MEGIILGSLGLFLLICTIFDVEWFMSKTRSVRSSYSFLGRKFTRILFGLVGLMFIFMALGSL